MSGDKPMPDFIEQHVILLASMPENEPAIARYWCLFLTAHIRKIQVMSVFAVFCKSWEKYKLWDYRSVNQHFPIDSAAFALSRPSALWPGALWRRGGGPGHKERPLCLPKMEQVVWHGESPHHAGSSSHHQGRHLQAPCTFMYTRMKPTS